MRHSRINNDLLRIIFIFMILIYNRKGREKEKKNENGEIKKWRRFRNLNTFTFNKRGDYKEYIKEIGSKGKIIARKV